MQGIVVVPIVQCRVRQKDDREAAETAKSRAVATKTEKERERERARCFLKPTKKRRNKTTEEKKKTTAACNENVACLITL